MEALEIKVADGKGTMPCHSGKTKVARNLAVDKVNERSGKQWKVAGIDWDVSSWGEIPIHSKPVETLRHLIQRTSVFRYYPPREDKSDSGPQA